MGVSARPQLLSVLPPSPLHRSSGGRLQVCWPLAPHCLAQSQAVPTPGVGWMTSSNHPKDSSLRTPEDRIPGCFPGQCGSSQDSVGFWVGCRLAPPPKDGAGRLGLAAEKLYLTPCSPVQRV